MVPVLEDTVVGGRGRGGRARRCAIESELGSAMTTWAKLAQASGGAELCVLQEATKVGPSICEAAEAHGGIEVGCMLCVELCLKVKDVLECRFWGRGDWGGRWEDSCSLAEMMLRR